MNSLDVLWHFGVTVSAPSGGRKGGAVISAGADMGVNLIDCFLIINTQESPDVGQRDGIQVKEHRRPRWFCCGRR